MKSVYCLFASVFLTGLAIHLSGCSQNAAGESDVSNSKSRKPVAVNTVAVTQQEVRRSTIQPATVHPFYAARIQAKVRGYVSDVKADIGDVVKAGQTLAVVDVPELEKQKLVAAAQLQQRRAEQERTAAGIENAKAGVQAAKAQAAEAESKLQQVEASLVAAEAEFQRTDDLVRRGSIEARMLDEVRKKRDSEAAGKAAVSSAIKSALANVSVAESQLASAQADHKIAAARTAIQERQIDEIDELLKFAVLTAPFDGVVTERNVSPGDLVGDDSDRLLFEISQQEKVRVRIPVPETDAAYVDRGDAVTLIFPSFPAEEPMTVKVTRLTGSLDPATRMMLVEAEVNNSEGRLLPGMFGQAQILMDTNAEAEILPARAVRFHEDGSAYVYVVSGQTVSIAAVTTGIDDGNMIEIVSGLEAGTMVIDAHLQRFTDGQTVRVLN